MKESKKNNSSLINRTPTSLTSVGNTLALTNKILTKYSVRIIPYRKYNKWYVFDINKNEIISEAYDSAEFLDHELTSSKSIIVQKKGLSAIFGNESNPTARNWYSTVEPLKSDPKILIACKDGQFGLISNSDDTLLPFEYEEIQDKLHFRDLLQHGLLCVRKNGCFGLISLKDYHQVLKPEYDHITDFSYVGDEDFLKIEKGNENGVYCLTTNTILFLGKFEDIINCNNSICSVKQNGKWLLYHYKDNFFVNHISYELTSPFINGFALCKKEENHFLVDESGNEELIPFQKSNEGRLIDFKRFDDLFIGTEKISIHRENRNSFFTGETYVFHVFRGSKQLSKIPHKTRDGLCTAKLNKRGLIEILAGSEEYLTTIKYYHINGKEVDRNSIQDINSEHKEKRSTPASNFKGSTPWRIDKNALFYNEKLVFEYPKGELVSSDLFLDFPKLAAIVGLDPKFGVKIDAIGYLDQEGKMYWEGLPSDDSFDNK